MADQDPKIRALQQQGTLNPRPKAVRDPLFLQDDFFDPRDLVQVKYEMLRRVRTEGQSVTDAAASFRLFAAVVLSGAIGLRGRRSCRPGAAQARSQAGAQAHRRGPHIHWRDAPERTVHSIAGPGETDPGTLRHQGSSTKYRAQPAAPSKKTPLNGAGDSTATHPDLAVRYEQLRRDAMAGPTWRRRLGPRLFLRRGMTAWMQAWSECTAMSNNHLAHILAATPMRSPSRCARRSPLCWRA